MYNSLDRPILPSWDQTAPPLGRAEGHVAHEKCFSLGTCVVAGNTRARMFTLGVNGESREVFPCRWHEHRSDPVLVQGEKERDMTVLPSPLTLFLVFETASLSPDRPGICVPEGGLPLCSTRVSDVHRHASLCLWL